MNYKLINGDCLTELKSIPDNSIDTIITDPPAGIAFMGKEWDKDKGGRDNWVAWMTDVMRECLRVLKPGGYAAVWALPRTSHWTATAVENAGFEIRDNIHYFKETSVDTNNFIESLSPEQLQSLEIVLSNLGTDNIFYHIFGQGFPKGGDISKHIDAASGAEREVIIGGGRSNIGTGKRSNGRSNFSQVIVDPSNDHTVKNNISLPATPEAQLWSGWNTSLKPAAEHWILAMKPLDGTFAQNALKYGVAGLNIDGSRIGNETLPESVRGVSRIGTFEGADGNITPQRVGRYPANVILDDSEEVLSLLPTSKGSAAPRKNKGSGNNCYGEYNTVITQNNAWGNSGSAARFFYCSKASKAERDAGLNELPERLAGAMKGNADGSRYNVDGTPIKQVFGRNHHPTVKPIELMRYLCRLTKTPTGGGTVLDPFMGSGSTGCAAILEDRDFIGIEQNAEYVEIARLRIEHYWKQRPETTPQQLQLIE